MVTIEGGWRLTPRRLQLALGLLWLLDTGLQLQPFMFGAGFARQIITPAAAGTPAFVHGPVHWAAHLILTHPVAFNAAFAVTQGALGVGLLVRRTVRAALVGSVLWALGIWWLGEGVGGIFGGATVLSGAPGAALLYAVVAVLAWPRSTDKTGVTRHFDVAGVAWAGLWLVLAGLQIASLHEPNAGVSPTFRNASHDLTGVLSNADQWLSQSRTGVITGAGLAAIALLIALSALIPDTSLRRFSVALGVALAIAGWVLVQGMGMLTSGQATDPNAGPLIVLIGAAALTPSVLRQTVTARLDQGATRVHPAERATPATVEATVVTDRPSDRGKQPAFNGF